jgi:hypothetical protein
MVDIDGGLAVLDPFHPQTGRAVIVLSGLLSVLQDPGQAVFRVVFVLPGNTAHSQSCYMRKTRETFLAIEVISLIYLVFLTTFHIPLIWIIINIIYNFPNIWVTANILWGSSVSKLYIFT